MAHTYLLDTNMFSYIATGASPTARAEFLRVSQDRESVLCISVITEAEVRYGMEKRSLSHVRRAAIEGLFAKLQILPWGSEEAAAFARAKAKLEARGITVALMDMLIAANGIAARAVLVTRDKIFSFVDDLDVTVNWATDI
jgi:tRNA(fMet)-specific endonuclease VapC